MPQCDFLKDKFQSVPTVIVTTEHISAAFKHDAANIWLQNVNQTSFVVCLRELQNFDGLHENIHVVCDKHIYIFPVRYLMKKSCVLIGCRSGWYFSYL